MTTSQKAAVSAALIALGSLMPAAAQTDPSIPVGTLDAYPTFVQTGTHPTLTWDIDYPSTVIDVIDILDPPVVVPTEDLYMDVRIVGTGVTRAYYDRRGRLSRTESVRAQCWTQVNNYSWNLLFDGKINDVNPDEVVYTRLVREGDRINFGARYLKSNGYWSTFYYTAWDSGNVVALVDGDLVPNNIPDWGAPSLESFLEPYMNQDNTVNVGPMDVFYVMELTHTNPNDSGYDLQDMIVLVTFRTVTSNN
ncbi:MAG: hypothetical protein AAGI48_06310 [Verrucomicrobiota bacterium]